MQKDEVSILVVDDVNTVRLQIRELLKSFGFKNITLAESGIEAKVLLDLTPFHLVVADWHMSPMNGLELLKYIRSQPKYQKLAFVMVTAENTKESVISAIQSGVDDYLMKPLTPMAVQNKIYGALLKKLG